MSLTPTLFRAPPLPEPAPIVRIVAAADKPWQPTLFRAPNLEVLTAAIPPAILPTQVRPQV
jgi:hypothetical protein